MSNTEKSKDMDVSAQLKTLSDMGQVTFVKSEEELKERIAESKSRPGYQPCTRSCDRTASTCFLKEAPLSLFAVSTIGQDPRADFSELHCTIEPCTVNATVQVPGCPPETVPTTMNAVRICGRLSYWFNFTEIFYNGCTRSLDFRTAAGQGSTCIDQTICHLPANHTKCCSKTRPTCPVTLCNSQISVTLRDVFVCGDKVYIIYNVNFTFPPCRSLPA